MKRNIKTIGNVIIMFLLISAIIFPREVEGLDELWIYNFARNIADGLLPYKDFNMVTTPLLPIICGLILKVTFNELIIMRFLTVLLITAIFYITYKILDVLKIPKYIINLIFVIIIILFQHVFALDYNSTILLITLTTLYYEIKNFQKHKETLYISKKDFFIGILIGSSILFKQTTGLIIAFLYVFYKLIFVSQKSELKKYLKIVFIRFIGIIIPVCLLIIYLFKNNIWNDFLDYTIFSIRTFTNRISYINFIMR